ANGASTGMHFDHWARYVLQAYFPAGRGDIDVAAFNLPQGNRPTQGLYMHVGVAEGTGVDRRSGTFEDEISLEIFCGEGAGGGAENDARIRWDEHLIVHLLGLGAPSSLTATNHFDTVFVP